MSRRRAARFGAVQALYQLEIAGGSLESVIAEFQGHRLTDLLEPLGEDQRPPKVDRDWFVRVTSGAWQRTSELDPLIAARLADGWSLARTGYVPRAFLRAGAYELTARPEVPAEVVIDEYVQLAHAFLSKDEAGFVNAVLDRLARELRADPEPQPAAPA
jgi:N utilization substance protein B